MIPYVLTIMTIVGGGYSGGVAFIQETSIEECQAARLEFLKMQDTYPPHAICVRGTVVGVPSK